MDGMVVQSLVCFIFLRPNRCLQLKTGEKSHPSVRLWGMAPNYAAVSLTVVLAVPKFDAITVIIEPVVGEPAAAVPMASEVKDRDT